MVPTVSSTRSFTLTSHTAFLLHQPSTTPPSTTCLKTASAASDVIRRSYSSQARGRGAVTRPTRGVCSPTGGRVQGPSFTRRSYSRSHSHYRPRQYVNFHEGGGTGGMGLGTGTGTGAVSKQHFFAYNNQEVKSGVGATWRNSSSKSMSSSQEPEIKPEDISSSRGRNAVSLLPVYLTDARAVTKYDPLNAPDGALQLSVAENQMLEDLLVPALRNFSVSSSGNVDDDSSSNSGIAGEGIFQSDQIYYQPTHGRQGLREAMAGYLERILKISNNQSLDLDGLVLGAGCNAVLENLCFCLTEPGDAVLLPTPYYAAFEFDLVARAALNIVPVNTMEYNSSGSSSSGITSTISSHSIPPSWYYPNTAALDAAYDKAKMDGSEPKILLLSHPNNPLGICYPPSVVKECVDWARKKKIHLVSDEIYAGSVYRKTNPLNGEDIFQSALTIASDGDEDKTVSDGHGLGLGPYVHFVYALSKDFALSGLRVGVAYSENEAIRMPMQKLNDLCQISSQTQQTVEQMLSAECDSGFWSTDEFLPLNNDRIRQRSDRVQLCLDECDIPCLFGDSGLFLWMDWSEFLPPSAHVPGESPEEVKDNRERKLYLELLQEFGLLFTPGRSMRNELPGYFRFVFTAASEDEFDLGLERVKKYVKAKRGSN